MQIENIQSDGTTVAIIIHDDFSQPGIHFVTTPEYSQQLAYIHHPAGKTIQPHVHVMVRREVSFTQEVLFIKKGKLRVDFYGSDQNYLESRILSQGDVILLASAGHGFEVLEEVEMIEVKQGPYVELEDKLKFPGISSDQVIYKTEG